MKKYAAIDIGTNSMRLLLADVENGKIVKRQKYINTTRIGSSVDKDRKISEEGIVRNIDALNKFAQQAKEYGAEKILAMATSAVRDAKNGSEFIKRAYEESGVDIKIISGEAEATLGYKGVVAGFKNNSSIVVIDIGGGSTEFILGEGSKLKEAKSLDIGAVRMTERYITTDPVSLVEYNKLEENIKEEVIGSVGGAFNTINTNHNLIGIGGTITTLASLHQELEPYDPDKIHNYKLTLKEITHLKQKLLKLKVEEIKNLKGIHPKRADIILAGITILSVIMENLGLEQITVSEYDNLEGMIYTTIC